MRKNNTKSSIEALERELTALERNLLITLQERLGRINAVTKNKSAEYMETVSNSELDDMASRLAELDSTKIDEIEAALQRLREDKYGICSDCGKNISKKRLRARPFATLCIGCKQRAEKEKRGDESGNNPRYSYARYEPGSGGGDGAPAEFPTSVRGDKF